MDILQGIDIVSVKRMADTASRQGERFLKRVFTHAERRYCESKRTKFEHYAARFAAKEAFLKAIEVRKSFKASPIDVEVRRRPTGKPYIRLSEPVRKRYRLPAKLQTELSMSHEREYAIASVIVIVPKK